MDGLSMSIASLSTDMAMAKTMTEVSTAVMKQNMDVNETLGNEMIKMMEKSVQPHLGNNVDVKL
ncbi:MAG: YjfB family protein [Catonella sp.]|uniref:YjfB family protein n=1 Tax=Catonella sp. TaxID=2382125 RepID=UPI003F9FB6A0